MGFERFLDGYNPFRLENQGSDFHIVVVVQLGHLAHDFAESWRQRFGIQ